MLFDRKVYKVTEYALYRNDDPIDHYYESHHVASKALVGFWARGLCTTYNGKVTPVYLEDKEVPPTEGIIVRAICERVNGSDELLYKGYYKVEDDLDALAKRLLKLCNGRFKVNGNGEDTIDISKYLVKGEGEKPSYHTILSTIMPIFINDEDEPAFLCFFSADMINLGSDIESADSIQYRIDRLLTASWDSINGYHLTPIQKEKQEPTSTPKPAEAPLVIEAVFTDDSPSIETFSGLESTAVMYDRHKPVEEQKGTAIVHVGAGPVDHVVDLPKVADRLFPFHFNAIGKTFFYFKSSDAWYGFDPSIRKHVAIQEYLAYKEKELNDRKDGIG